MSPARIFCSVFSAGLAVLAVAAVAWLLLATGMLLRNLSEERRVRREYRRRHASEG